MQNNPSLRPNLSRLDFLKLIAAAGLTTAGAYAINQSAPWLDYQKPVEQTWRNLAMHPVLSTQMLELIRYATLAANGHNSQPWRFAILENGIQIHPDFTRRLPVVDPHDRELWISLGCALENLLVASRAVGYAPQVTYPDVEDFIHVSLSPDTPQRSPLFDAIPQRQNNRSEYNGRLIHTGHLDQVRALPLEPGVVLRFVLNPSDMEVVTEYVHQGNLDQYGREAYLDELIDWLRFNKKQALASQDGLFSRCSGNPEVPGWLGRMFVSGTKPQAQAGADAKKLRTSPTAVVVASGSDHKTAWVRTGQVYERMALVMTSLNIQSALMNQPIEVADLRAQFQGAIGLEPDLPQLLVRFGYADPMPRSLRRPVEQVLI
jgi:hypothetical protein